MFFADSADKKRVLINEAVAGEDYFCPTCGEKLYIKAADSKLVATHFYHKKKCTDLWYDYSNEMSEWHIGWQMRFPEECREVVVEHDGDKHRADILINNTVIEFQHSHISAEEFDTRTRFYKNCGYRVVWVFDATNKTQYADCGPLEWKRKNGVISTFSVLPDNLLLDNAVPEHPDTLICIQQIDPKVIYYHDFVRDIKPESFLKEFGAIEDEDIPSISDIASQTQEFARMARALQMQQRKAKIQASANEFFNSMIQRGRGRRGYF